MSGHHPLQRTSIQRDTYAHAPRHPLVVCASLVQNPTNLGGLCRTTEVFRMETLVMADLSITEVPAFYKPAASAQHWQPLMACPPETLVPWLQEQRRSGYTILALQTAADAAPLTEFCFPKQAVLVLGRELTGVPPEVMQQCDRTIAIPQYGLVESLNVQTAAAIALYEYVRQHPLS
jgi:tRNA G18 (ribose-2'-O)-methylase SpoU